MSTEILGIIVIFVLSVILAIPLGKYITKVYAGSKTLLDPVFNPVERLFYRVSGIDPDKEMNWKQHLVALLTINLIWFLLSMLILMTMGSLPLNPDHNPGMPPDLAFNTAISFVVNCNLQHYSGETGISYLGQMWLMFLQFVSAGTGMAAAVVVFRAFRDKTTTRLGNFYNYLVKSCVRILLPISLLIALVLVFEGTPMTFEGKDSITTLQGDPIEVSGGPAAAFIAIKHVGTNGGGFFGANSAHPFENPSYLTNMVEMFAQLVIPIAMIFAFGYFTGRKRLSRMIFGVMTVGFLFLVVPNIIMEMKGNPAISAMGIDNSLGAMEGKEIRIGAAASGFWSIVTTVISTGSVNAMHDSTMPLSGMNQLLAMMANSFYGGVGVGILNFLIFIVLAVFISGLMIGRTPEFLGKKIEARGKAQADSLRKTREETPARLQGGSVISSAQLKKGDVFVCEAGDIVPADGEIIEGLATIDESAITGESAPVVREAGGDKSSVTGGTKVLSDKIIVKVVTRPGESFLDKMIALVEGASRQKTPNEIALTILLAGFVLIFIIVCVTLKPFADYANVSITIGAFISLFVCLIPTTIGGLLSAIGIAGMDRALRANVITKSGKAVETAGDIDVLLLDKTGTITIGNRKATHLYPADGVNREEFVRVAVLSSSADQTPEGKSIVELAQVNPSNYNISSSRVKFIEFTAETRCSGVDIGDTQIRKGAADAIRALAEKDGNPYPEDVANKVKTISEKGGTPLVVSVNNKIVGTIELQDIIKPGIQERFERLRKMGIKTVMVTGDNPLTARYISEKVGVDDFIAEAKPEDKMNYIKKEQNEGRLVAMMGDGTNDAPALAQANVGVAMNSGTEAAKEAGNMVDLDNDPTKLIEVVEIGKQLLMTRGTLTTFSIANDVAKYFAIIPALFITAIPALQNLNIMKLGSPESAILSAIIFNAIIIPILIPLALKGVAYKPIGASALLRRNLLIYGFGGIMVPFAGIKLIDMVVSLFI